MTSRQYHAIDEEVAAVINRLHKRYPKLGPDGLLGALRQQGIHVDPQELEAFMKEHRIRPERFWRGWAFRGAPASLTSWAGGTHPGGFDGDAGDGGDCD